QHGKELFCGAGNIAGTVRASIVWPSGFIQAFEQLPINRRIEIREGSSNFAAKPYSPSLWSHKELSTSEKLEPLPTASETWLIEPLAAPYFSLPDFAVKTWQLRSLLGNFVLLTLCSPNSEISIEQLRLLR